MTQAALFDDATPTGPQGLVAPDAPPGVFTECDRCPSREYRDMVIHNGRSLRRDCRECGRTLGFPVWNPEI